MRFRGAIHSISDRRRGKRSSALPPVADAALGAGHALRSLGVAIAVAAARGACDRLFATANGLQALVSQRFRVQRRALQSLRRIARAEADAAKQAQNTVEAPDTPMGNVVHLPIVATKGR